MLLLIYIKNGGVFKDAFNTVKRLLGLRPQVEADNYGKIVAINIETGAFAIADDTLTASQKLLAKCPHAQTWVVRIGHRAVQRFGARSLKYI